MESGFELPIADVVSGRINELAVEVECGQTRLVVKYFEPMDSPVVSELEYAAHRIEILAGGRTLPIKEGGEVRAARWL
jgi:hypothetical protein